ncbi:NlpC/P60 family protein [Phaeospirillum tilakii]|uniref:NlpC/P60 family protein n=1 Tax=Phaeospirillum tilakii TaxID=741673 RepID=A0ABW5CFM6_9PROT
MTDLEASQRAAVVAEARSWLGTPYHERGRVKGAGVDCAMLPAEIYAGLGLIGPQDPGYYPPDWHLHRGVERYLAAVERVARLVDAPLPGDLVMYRFGRAFAHGAIVTGWPTIIHAVKGLGVIESSGDGPEVAGRVRRAYRLRVWS